jgi:hypothetical protein
VYYSKADNEFLVPLNEDEDRIDLTTKYWETDQDNTPYVIYCHPVLKEEIRINKSEWLQDEEGMIKENINLDAKIFDSHYWDPYKETCDVFFL